MRNCPLEIIDDSTINTYQEREELCRRYYEDKKMKSKKSIKFLVKQNPSNL